MDQRNFNCFFLFAGKFFPLKKYPCSFVFEISLFKIISTNVCSIAQLHLNVQRLIPFVETIVRCFVRDS